MDGVLDLSPAGICGKIAGALIGGVAVKGYEEKMGTGKKLRIANQDLAEANAAAKQAQVAAVITLATTVIGFGAWGLKKAWSAYKADAKAQAPVVDTEAPVDTTV